MLAIIKGLVVEEEEEEEEEEDKVEIKIQYSNRFERSLAIKGGNF